MLFDAFSFPDEFLKFSTVKEHLFPSFGGEVRRLCVSLARMKEDILSQFNAVSRNTDQENHTGTITLKDIFRYVDKSDFPQLWKSVLEVRVINPTTVSCEQSISCLKHSKHNNMQNDNLCRMVDFRLSIVGNDSMDIN